MGQSSSEFDLIHQYFQLGVPSHWPSQGIGDDCAIVQIGQTRLAITCDTAAIGTHFLPQADPYTVGRKILAVNLSDLAAAGAVPRAFFLAISLPENDPAWLSRFSLGLQQEARRYQCALLGGDTTKTVSVNGTLAAPSMSITAMGEVKKGLTRSGAKPGDDIWVSGTLGDAYTCLMSRWGRWSVPVTGHLAQRMDTPTPRVELGQAIEPLASAAADVSDGFLADLGHILERSGVSARVWADAFAASEEVAALSAHDRHQAQLTGGDDYELVFTAPVKHRRAIAGLATEACPVTRVGEIVHAEHALTVLDRNQQLLSFDHLGFDHFED